MTDTIDQTNALPGLHARLLSEDVTWHGAARDAMDAAQRTSRPIFAYIGSATCPASAAFENTHLTDPRARALLADNFVALAVDVAHDKHANLVLQTGISAIGGAGGWPVAVFLTPDGWPVWFSEPDDFETENQNGLKQDLPYVLDTIARAFQDNDPVITDNARQTRAHIAEALQQPQSGILSSEDILSSAKQAMSRLDLEKGGITGPAKFPNTPFFETVWRGYLATGQADYAAGVQLAYTSMCSGALFDHFAGGFFRFSPDTAWESAFPEKTLYDNALILSGLTMLHGNLPQLQYAQAITQTADFLIRDLRLPSGAFASGIGTPSLDLYTWTRDALTQTLGKAGSELASVFDINDTPTLPKRTTPPNPKHPRREANIMAACSVLATLRQERSGFTKDTRVQIEWNGLAICALVQAAMVLERPDWLTAATHAYEAVKALSSKQNVLSLGDLASLGAAAVALAQAKEATSYLDDAAVFAQTISAEYIGPDGAFMLMPADASPWGPVYDYRDQPVPSASAQAIRLFMNLGCLTGTADYSHAARRALQAIAGAAARWPLAACAIYAAYDDLNDGIDVFVGSANFNALTVAWAARPPGARVIAGPLQTHNPLSGLLPDPLTNIVVAKSGQITPPLAGRQAAIDALRTIKRTIPDASGSTLMGTA